MLQAIRKRGIVWVAGFVALLANGIPTAILVGAAHASPPVWFETRFMDIRILSADPLDEGNVGQVSHALRSDMKIAASRRNPNQSSGRNRSTHIRSSGLTPTSLCSQVTGRVLRCVTLRQRTVRTSFYGFEIPEPIDTGWVDVTASQVDTLFLSMRHSPRPKGWLPEWGDTLHVGTTGYGECDTWPPRGECAIDNVIVEADASWLQTFWGTRPESVGEDR